MTAFNGRIKELHCVLIDNFIDFKSYTCFFLSHCHADHLNNIENLLSFLEENENVFLYCSPISRLILINQFNVKNESVIKELVTPRVINVPESGDLPSYDITVTPVPTGHCAGAIMFLLESVDKIILYTGDMRISQNDIQKFKALHSNSHVRILDKVYLDSTFFNEQYWSFPSRTEVVAALTNRIRNFLGKNSSNQILLRTSALIGYEYAFIAIARKLKRQIHVSDFLYRIFSYVPEVGSALTNDCQKARIHVITPRCKPCLEDSKKKNVLHVKLSAQWYKSSRNSEPKLPYREVTKQYTQFCYATHCSCSELIEILDYLRPKECEPCSATIGSTKEQTQSYIREIMSSWTLKTTPRLENRTENPLLRNDKFKLKFVDNQDEDIKT